MLNEKFIENFVDTEDLIGNFVRKIKGEKKKVVLFGTGYCLKLFIDLMRDNNIDIVYLCDNDPNKEGKLLFGLEIKGWKFLRHYSEEFNVVISTSHYKEIENQLIKDGYLGKIYYLPQEAYYKNSIYGKQYLIQHLDRFQKVYDLLEDDISKKVFVNVIKHNISLNNCYYKEIEDLEIHGYFGTDLYCNKNNEIIIDGGAFDGDTYREFLSNPLRKFKEYIAYEPDEDNYNIIENIQDKKLTVLKKGLGNKKEMLRFISGMGVSSNFSESGEKIVEVDAIDNLEPRRKITFIKMDIEGAEKSALLGAEKVIGNDRPTLAISAYHKKEDMYDLVETIKNINSRYKIYFRHTFYYQKQNFQPDVIIYAV